MEGVAGGGWVRVCGQVAVKGGVSDVTMEFSFFPSRISCRYSCMSERVVAFSFFMCSCSVSIFAIISPFNLMTMLSCSSRIFIWRSLAAIISVVFQRTSFGLHFHVVHSQIRAHQGLVVKKLAR